MLFRKSDVEKLAEEIGEERAKILLKLAQSTRNLEKILKYSDNILENFELLKRPNLKELVELGEALMNTAEYLNTSPGEVLRMAEKHAKLRRVVNKSYAVTLAPKKGLFYATVPDLKTALSVPEAKVRKEIKHSSGKFTLAHMLIGDLGDIL